MIRSRAWTGKRYAVLGLARSGLATVAALIASGAEVLAWDDRAEARDEAAKLGASISDPLEADLTGMAGVIVSPGVPLNRHPIAAHAKAAGVPIIGDIELFAQARAELPPHRVVGITGTNGKSTTTALVHHILKTAGVPTTMGGNIGLPILGQQPLPAGGVYVLELSSYQIDLTFSLDCDVAVLLNVTPDHLDRYADFAAYEFAKARLFSMQSETSNAIISGDPVSVSRVGDIFDDGRLPFRGRSGFPMPSAESLMPYLSDALNGPHNAANAANAMLAAQILGVVEPQVLEALSTYPGLPHRMERVGEHNGVAFINDSKATNAEAAAPALAAFRAVRWILGGRAKTAELDACLPHLGHVRSAYTIGEAGPMLADLLRPKLPVTEAETLERAVTAAAADAQSGDTVLLSPACASFDQFRDFEDRGDQFRALVKGLKA
ncbi:MAG: UDP-N-acetylmuramoyl-L-alanine--D-glutamate ligase [Sphingopyxis sp.]|nr:UDP-N-acetylmuramoyl-L-alanine--D-glutamate ligase [Sphingopyxis sp.]